MKAIGTFRWLAILLAAATAGCAGLKPRLDPVADITPSRELRKEDVVRDFERHRDQAQFDAARCCLDRGDVDGCRESLEAMLARNPNHEEARLLLAELSESPDTRLAAAEAALTQGDLVQARLRLSEFLAGAADRGEAAVAAGVVALKHGHPALAVELLQPVRPGETVSAAHHRTLATAWYRLGDYAAAEAELRQALLLDKSSALSYFLMGCTLSQRGQKEAAEANFQQARTLDPRFQRAG